MIRCKSSAALLAAFAAVSASQAQPPTRSPTDLGPTISLPELRAACPGGKLLPELRALAPAIARPRIPYPTDPSRVENAFGSRQVNAERALGHLPPDVLAPLKGLGVALMRSDVVDPKLRELVIVRVGYLSRSAYEVRQHASLAMSLGVTKAKVTAMSCAAPQGLDAPEAAAIRFVDDVVRNVRPGDTSLSAVRNHFSDRQVLQFVTITGQWMMAARQLETLGVSPDDFVVGDQGVPANLRQPPR